MPILFTIGCPKCKILEKKLNEKGIKFQTISDIDDMNALGITVLPVLLVEGVYMDFKHAVEWVKKK